MILISELVILLLCGEWKKNGGVVINDVWNSFIFAKILLYL